MMSFETRDAVKDYELSQNVLLRSILPGGLLESLEVKQRCETLLVPRQASLEVVDIAQYFLATPQSSCPAAGVESTSLLTALFGEDEETLEKGRGDTPKTRDGCGAPGTPGVTFPPENGDAFRAALARFLDYHLLHFDSFGISEFVNLNGQRGAFAEDLDHVKRFGHFGKIPVIADAGALCPSQSDPGTAVTVSAADAAARTLSCRPSSLQMFIIDQPLMDSNEISFIRNTLRKLCLPMAPRVTASEGAVESTTGLAKISSAMNDPNTEHIPAQANLPNLSACTLARIAALDMEEAKETDPAEGLCTETVVIEDFEDEPPKDADLEACVTKHTYISEQQRQRQSSECKCAEGTMARAASSARFDGCLASAPSPSTSSSSAKCPQAVRMTPTCSSQQPFSGSGATASALPTTTPASLHANVLRREYSRECIKDYRRVVAADNDIAYNVFEDFMSTQCPNSLAMMLSEYVSKNQQLQQPILNNIKYNTFIEKCHAQLRHIPFLSRNKSRLTAVREGIERYVTTRLYRQLFNVSEDDKRKNTLLQQKLTRLENMAPESLDALPEVERHHVWGQAMFELDGMDFFISPREKLRCGMRAYELLSLAIGDILRQRRHAAQGGSASPTGSTPTNVGDEPLVFGADASLPCFLLLVLRARPLSFVHNVSYIEKFRHPTLMSDMESYCLATLQSSLIFWQNCRDDGQISPAAAAGTTPGGGASLLHTAGSTDSHALATCPSPISGIIKKQPPPPRMTENDLLPSVRQTSLSRRQQATAVTSNACVDRAAVLPGGSVSSQEESPTGLDVLFGCSNRKLMPVASDASPGTKGVSSRGNPAPPPHTKSAGDSLPGTAPGLAARQLPPQGTLLASTSVVPHAGAVPQVNVEPSFHTDWTKSPISPQCASNASSRERVRDLLITQNKSFEQLTPTELRMVVEQARLLLREGR
ncbi:hypothetical protein JKF63_00742 [Porcisia hertigi]|uniref:VPS9 domain-containing protein n=1 Tax=Porcisia hertigi TaxID=2761500 RepID=A0A836HC69_9TRYP|nr:hypothetical protein JKF63_00742 [Porcisia hertigi]